MRTLGNSSLEVSPITLGAFAIGGTMWGGNEKKDSIAAIQASIDNGVTSIDTAPFYGFGLSESLIGEAIKGRDRSTIQILTKFGLVWDGSNNGNGDFFFEADGQSIYKYASKATIIKEVEESLQRLGTDYIDLLQLHWPDSTTPISETMEAMEILIQQGKIKAAGVSNYTVSQLEEAQKSVPLASNQVAYSMLNRSIETDLVPYSLDKNIGIIAYSPMERGLLTGKYFAGGKLAENDHRNGYFNQYDLKKVQQFLQNIQPIADAKNSTLAQLVLRWTVQQPGITAVLAGARNAEQAISNAQALHFELNPEELTFITNQLHTL
ncbi:aldo/keto reductase [Flavobacterium sp. WV_118_3]|uniref:aldo/keto reductase n=1 Tax=Flavobacterium sp. WV_118_3 TaxID=3151764 RepID=UPI003219BB98